MNADLPAGVGHTARAVITVQSAFNNLFAALDPV
jgi:hypothetical protein